MSDEFLTVKQAAARMGRSVAWIHHLIKTDRLPTIRPGMEYMIKASDVDSFEHQPRGKPPSTDQVAASKSPKPKRRAASKSSRQDSSRK